MLLRRDHTDLFNSAGKSAGSLDQIMMIYSEGDTLHADYSDGQHVIHYDRADIEPGQAVTFTSSVQPRTPSFRLSFRLTPPGSLSVSFAMAPPATTSFRSVAEGVLNKAP